MHHESRQLALQIFYCLILKHHLTADFSQMQLFLQPPVWAMSQTRMLRVISEYKIRFSTLCCFFSLYLYRRLEVLMGSRRSHPTMKSRRTGGHYIGEEPTVLKDEDESDDDAAATSEELLRLIKEEKNLLKPDKGGFPAFDNE